MAVPDKGRFDGITYTLCSQRPPGQVSNARCLKVGHVPTFASAEGKSSMSG